MNRRKLFHKAAVIPGFLILFFGIPVVVFQGVRLLDSTVSHRLSAASEPLVVDAEFDGRLHPIALPDSLGDSVRFSLENRSDEHLTLSLRNLFFPHRIYTDGKPVSQNINRESPGYDSAMRSKDFVIPPRSPVQTFRVEGNLAGGIRAYLGRRATMRLQQRMAGELNSFLTLVVLTLGLLNLIVSAVHKSLNRLSVAILLVFVFCLMKIALADSSAIGSMLLPVSASHFQLWDFITTFGFSLSLFLIYAFFFDVQPRRLFYFTLAGYTVLMLVNYAATSLSQGALVLLPVVLVFRVLLFIWILGFAVLTEKPFAKSIFMMHAVSDGLIVYYVFLNNHPAAGGLLPFYFDIAFLGFSIQFLFALMLFVSRTLIQSRDYNRLLMLRGLEHDLKIPLSIIKLNHQMIRRYSLRDDDAKGIRFSEAIDRAFADLEHMLQNLRYHLECSPSTREERTELVELFRTLEENFQAVCAARNAVLEVDVPDSSLYAAMDPDVLKRVLHNLLDNAFKHGGAGLRVSLRAKERAGKIVITIRDNGEGMTERERRKAVSLFHKSDPARGTSGLGLGLHVVRNLVQRNHGTLVISSKKGEGTAVSVTLPRS
ncbi:MAG: HAMP domain-containing sensor histidine kinase [Kiritimatiellae bacterium]|nr:HAMP domain-containing sensor histidine kinase [Kiritimatiellia bacterium]